MNPWQQQGVSILPGDLKDLLPLVGQKSLFDELQRFKKSCLAESSSERLAGFFVLHGGWGVGKSRVGHEICLEAVSDQVDWIVDTKPQRILECGLADGILPLFTRYIHVTDGPLGDQLNAENWIPMVAVEALSALLKSNDSKAGKTLKRNQDRLLERILQTLKPRMGRGRGGTLHGTGTGQPRQGRPAGAGGPRELGVEASGIVVDEIEDITDVDRDGLNPDDRERIDQELLTVIPRVIKQEDDRLQYLRSTSCCCVPWPSATS